jgi:tetratricopeptide (TPR) repeat protein
MKNKIFLIALFAAALSGCADFTDIEPKGKNLLSSAEDLDLLLNYDYRGYSTLRHASLTGAILPYSQNLTTLATQDPKTVPYAWGFWDEGVDRAQLTVNDALYEELYKMMATRCNPVLSRADAASGDHALIDKLRAEAHILRAWWHYIAVNFFAEAYDPQSAATDGGTPYLLHTDVMSQPLRKYTVAEVYDLILADIDAALELDALPDENINRQRANKAFAYAVQAKVLMSLRRFDEALTAARNSLAITDHIDDHNTMYAAGPYANAVYMTRPQMTSAEDLLYTYTDLYGIIISPELLAMFDPDAVFRVYMPDDVRILGASYSYLYGAPDLPFFYYTLPTYYSVSGCGLTTVDMHLTEAECLMRGGQTGQAMQKLETIRRNRILTDRYAPAAASTKAEVFDLLKRLSRCENFYTVKDFIDLKRWNTEPEYAATLHRTIVGRECSLAPDSDLWIFPFPQSATNFNPNLTQNY